jgi:hypothetical protein
VASVSAVAAVAVAVVSAQAVAAALRQHNLAAAVVASARALAVRQL